MPKVIQPLNPSIEPEPSPSQQPAVLPAAPQPPTSAQTVEQPEPQAPPVNPIYPSADSSTQFASNPITPYLTAASAELEEKNSYLPVGVYVIAGLIMLQALAGFFTASMATTIGKIEMVVSVIFAIAALGLLLRRNGARIAVIVFAIISIIASSLALFGLQVTQSKWNVAKHSYNLAIERAQSSKQISASEQASIDRTKAEIESLEKQLNKGVVAATINESFSILLAGIAIVYLTREKVRGYF